MDMAIEQAEHLAKLILSGAGAVVLLILIVKFLLKDRDRLLLSISASNAKNIEVLQAKAVSCEEDRIALRQEVSRLNDEMRKMNAMFIELITNKMAAA